MSEARLASLLARGSSLAEAAERLEVSINTVRTQIKNLFAKTNTSRQAQLAALLAKLPRVGLSDQRIGHRSSLIAHCAERPAHLGQRHFSSHL